MWAMSLAGVDLNLLVVSDALLREGNVTRAAGRCDPAQRWLREVVREACRGLSAPRR